MAKEVKEKNKNIVDLSDIKVELEKYVDLKIKEGFNDTVERANKRLIKEKNKKIFFKNIIILLLVVIIIFLLYLLYDNNYFNRFFYDGDNNIVDVVEDNNEPVDIIKEDTLEDKIKEYGKLIDKIVINEKSEYINDFYNGNLTEQLKNYLTLNIMNFKEFEVEEDYNIINPEELERYHDVLFNTQYTNISFNYNESKIKYYSKIDTYISNQIITKEKSNIIREIIDIKKDKNNITITTIEGLLKDNKLYNIVSGNEIKDYDGKKIQKYEEKLNKVEYVFNNEFLVDIN